MFAVQVAATTAEPALTVNAVNAALAADGIGFVQLARKDGPYLENAVRRAGISEGRNALRTLLLTRLRPLT